MQVKCEYCGSYISDTDEFCSQCGAVNPNFKRSTDGTPKTISELKVWYKEKNLPDKEVTRFFIGENYKGAKAFGIYEENGEYIVYKNKADGTRAIRYQGKDESYAVNEIYLKLKKTHVGLSTCVYLLLLSFFINIFPRSIALKYPGKLNPYKNQNNAK